MQLAHSSIFIEHANGKFNLLSRWRAVDSRAPMEPVFGREGVCILESRHGRSFEMPETRDDFFKVLYPFRGSGWLLVGRSRHRLQFKNVVLIPPLTPHRITDSSPMALYIVCIQKEFVERISGAVFREEAGESWLQAIRRLRIGHAHRLLAETGHSVTAIAFQSGFNDLSHFHRVFKSCSNGLTPESWRRLKSGNGLAEQAS